VTSVIHFAGLEIAKENRRIVLGPRTLPNSHPAVSFSMVTDSIASARDFAALARSRIDAIVRDYVAKNPNAALVVGFIHGNEKGIYGWGRPTVESTDAADAHTVFEIGSITKLFTANLLADLALEQRVRLHDPASKYLPAGVRMPTYRDRAITLFQLATHTSSLPRLPKNLWKTVKDEQNPYANYSVEDLYDFLNQCRLWRMVGSQVAYSNLGMGLLGHILALIDGRPYERAVIERICLPFEMTDTSITLSEAQQQRLAQGHNAKGEPAPKWDLPTLAGAGALSSTATDMLRYLEANLTSAPEALKPTLTKCQLLRRKTATTWGAWQDFVFAGILSGCALALQKWWPIPPGSSSFLLLLLLPVAIAAWRGGVWPGLFAGALCVAGAYGLWGDQFGWPVGIGFAVAVALYCSRRGWSREGVMLGWQHTRIPSGALLLWHNGMTGGYASWCGIVREMQTGVIVLSSAANSVDDLGERITASLGELDDDEFARDDR
jgi:CubicO group peptidase (beta-lactamase class C family)